MDTVAILRRICELQPVYSSSNTREMQERGRLIRTDLPNAIREKQSELEFALAEFGDDFAVEGSDGIGRKTEAPWVRFSSLRMSPSPREGYYVVVHFAADGSAIFVTVGCGSTVWSGGDLKAVSDGELKRRTDVGRRALLQRFGSLGDFGDQIELGAKARLPRTFEKATVVAARIPVAEIEEFRFTRAIISAAKMLGEIYRQVSFGAAEPPDRLIEMDLEVLTKPGRRLRGQGYGLTGEERRAVEIRAMQCATDWLIEKGFEVEDRSQRESFDLAASRSGEMLEIEVKGTTADGADVVLMTKNEVELHRNRRGTSGLIVVCGIALKLDEHGVAVATGGSIVPEVPWDIEKWDLEPIAFRVRRRRTDAE